MVGWLIMCVMKGGASQAVAEVMSHPLVGLLFDYKAKNLRKI